MPVHVYTAQRDLYRGRDLLDLTSVTALSRAFVDESIIVCAPARVSVVTCACRVSCVLASQLSRTASDVAAYLDEATRGHRVYVFTRDHEPVGVTCFADVFGKLGACLGGELRLTDRASSTTTRNRSGSTVARRKYGSLLTVDVVQGPASCAGRRCHVPSHPFVANMESSL